MQDQDTLEVWKPVPFATRYEVSSYGRVRCTERDVILKQTKHPRGYRRVRLTHDDGDWKNHLAHRVVALAFIGPCPEGHQVNHLNCQKDDNRASNLEYVTPQGNTDHAKANGLLNGNRPKLRPPVVRQKTKYKLTPKEVDAIRLLLETKNQNDLAKFFNVSQTAIWKIKEGKSYRQQPTPRWGQ